MTNKKAQFDLVEPFDIDDGELAGISPQECFCLGAEFIQVRAALETGKPMRRPVLSNNAVRLAAMASRHGRFVEHHPSETEGWEILIVGGNKP